MSRISTGVGPVSGLPINDLVDSLIQIQRRPIVQLQNRLTTLTSRKTALLKISAQLLSIRNSGARFGKTDFLQAARAASSHESIVLATASSGAVPGQFAITVRRLATSQQVISSGFATADTTPVGAGTLTIENVRGQVSAHAPLSQLRGGLGVRPGRIRIQDRAGGAADVDLTAAVTIDDVLSAINSQTRANVRARIDGDRLLVEDRTGATTGSLSISDQSGSAAADLGVATSSAAGAISGADLIRLSETTRLDLLNDGNGVRRLKGAADFSVSLADGSTLQFDISGRLQESTRLSLLNGGSGVQAGSIRITNRAGTTQVVDLTSAQTAGEVKTAIEAAGLSVSVLISAGGFRITDNSTGTGNLKVEEVSGGATAKSLGLTTPLAGGVITGRKVYFVDTVGDLLRVIHSHPENGGRLAASISADGKGLTLRDATSGDGAFQVSALNDSRAADDLGLLRSAEGGTIQSRRLIAGLGSVLLRSLNGGRGVSAGTLRLTDRAGATAEIDLSAAHSLSDVIAEINTAPTGIRAAVSASGLGIEIRDTSGGGGSLIIEDAQGTTAADLKIAINVTADRHASGNLQKQYVSGATKLGELRGATPFVRGRFRITDSAGASDVIDLTQGDEETIQDVINEINSRPNIQVTAAINATGDGIQITDGAGGAGLLKIAEDGSNTARSLGILGEAKAGSTTMDGSLETRITIGGSDTLNDVASAVRASGAGVSALVLRDSADGQSHRLSITSNASGREGSVAVESSAAALSFDTLVRGGDAVALFGPPDAANPLILTSATNTLSNAIPGVRLDLIGVSEQPASITITRDVESAIKDLSAFVTAFNAAISTIDDLTAFDAETRTRSALTGDPATNRVRQRLLDLANRVVAGASAPFNRLSGAGIGFTSGSALTFDEAKFRAALASNPASLEAFFTTKEKGFGAVLESEIKRLVDGDTAVIPAQQESIKQTEELLSKRILDMETLVARRRERLLAQFAAAETAIARLQSQQSVLGGLGSASLGLSLG